MWVFLPKIHAPNRPRILQQDFTAVPVVCEQPGDSVSWSFLGVAQGSCALWCTGGSWARSPTKLNKNAQLALQGAPARWLDQPCPSRQRTWVLGYQHSRVCSRGGTWGWGSLHATARHRGALASWEAAAGAVAEVTEAAMLPKPVGNRHTRDSCGCRWWLLPCSRGKPMSVLPRPRAATV